ncbi:hypothetical protein ACFE04_018802 [Oxalis oulophora]
MKTETTYKRKYSHDHKEDHNNTDDDDEEKKIEKFFAIITRIREARDSLLSGSSYHASDDHDDQINKKRKLEDGKSKQKALAWEPSFVYEDFVQGCSTRDDQFIIKDKQNKSRSPPLINNFFKAKDLDQPDELAEKMEQDSSKEARINLSLSL